MSNIQTVSNTICKARGIPAIKIRFIANSSSSSQGMYATYHYRGSKVNIPKYIKYIALYMPDWFAEKYPDEVAPILAHELAHHELNTKTGSLRHSKAHTRLTKTLEQAIMRSLA